MSLILESFILSCAPTRAGEFISCGIVQTTADELLQFFRQADGSLLLGDITQEGNTVTIERKVAMSGVVTERNTCLCLTGGDADMFYESILAVAHRQDWERNKDSVLAWVNGDGTPNDKNKE